jgi:hypothetical protein
MQVNDKFQEMVSLEEYSIKSDNWSKDESVVDYDDLQQHNNNPHTNHGNVLRNSEILRGINNMKCDNVNKVNMNEEQDEEDNYNNYKYDMSSSTRCEFKEMQYPHQNNNNNTTNNNNQHAQINFSNNNTMNVASTFPTHINTHIQLQYDLTEEVSMDECSLPGKTHYHRFGAHKIHATIPF